MKDIKSFFNRALAILAAVAALLSSFFNGDLKDQIKNYVYLDVSYGTHERQIFDLYIPRCAKGETGVILFLHAGGWIEGDKEPFRSELRKWSSKGYAAAAMNYRFISRDEQITMNEEMEDITSALAKMKEIASKKGIDLNKVLLAGASAGAHLSLLYAYTHVDDAPVTPAAVVSYCGPTMLWDETFIFNNEFGGFDPSFMTDLLSKLSGIEMTPDDYEAALPKLKEYSPIIHVNENTVPTVLAYGMQDQCVPYHTGVALDEKLTEYGVEHEFVSYPNSGHALDQDPECNDRTKAFFAEYAEKYLKQ